MSKSVKTDSVAYRDRPRVTVSVAVTQDGYVAMTDSTPLRISSERDLVEVHRLRAASDAILVGAATLRKDNCQLTVRHGQGGPGKPMRITLTRSGCIDYRARFFADDGARKVIFCPASVESVLRTELPEQTVVVALDGESCSLSKILATLKADGVNELMIEGGASVISQFLREQLVDRVRLAIGPIIAGAAGKTRLFDVPTVTALPDTVWRSTSVEEFGDTAVTWYEFADVTTH